jgi:hypothetical protein
MLYSVFNFLFDFNYTTKEHDLALKLHTAIQYLIEVLDVQKSDIVKLVINMSLEGAEKINVFLKILSFVLLTFNVIGTPFINS